MRRQFVPAAIKAPSATVSSYASYSSAAIPAFSGLKTSAAFFTSLGANLRITDDDLNIPSPLNTPQLRPYDFMSASAKSPLASLSASHDDNYDISALNGNRHSRSPKRSPTADDPPIDPLAGIPELTTYAAESDEDRVAGLKLVADSVAQQRQVASRILIFHPACMSALALALALAAHALHRDRSDWPRILTTWAGLVMAYLLGVRALTRDYLAHAERIDWDWLGRDTLLVSKFGDEVIGALVLTWVAGGGRGSRRKRVGRGLIRAWTVRLRYRGRGVGAGLLEEAVGVANRKGGEGIDFAEGHANSTMVLKPFFNAPFYKRDVRAQDALDEVIRQKGTFFRRGSR